jgi:hypothetical protein
MELIAEWHWGRVTGWLQSGLEVGKANGKAWFMTRPDQPMKWSLFGYWPSRPEFWVATVLYIWQHCGVPLWQFILGVTAITQSQE